MRDPRDDLLEIEKLFAECWSEFSKEHPEFQKPRLQAIQSKDVWGCCVHDAKRPSEPATILVNIDILSKYQDRDSAKDIIYHELCHLIYFDNDERNAFGHPREFWDELDKWDSKSIKQKAEVIEHNKKEFDKLVEDLEW